MCTYDPGTTETAVPMTIRDRDNSLYLLDSYEG